MDFLGTLSAVGSVLNPLIQGGTSLANMYREDYWNKRQEDMTRESWAREDNAVQRRVADLKAAGLNPALAAGSAASTSGAANFTSSNQMQFNFDDWIKSPVNREILKQEKSKSSQEKNLGLIYRDEALQSEYDLILKENIGRLFGIDLVGSGDSLHWSYDPDNPGLNILRMIAENDIKTSNLQSQYNYDQQSFFNKHQDFSNAMNLFKEGVSPLLDVLDVVGSLRRNFGTYRGDFTYRRR